MKGFILRQFPLIIRLKRLLFCKNYKSFFNFNASNLMDIKSAKNTFFGYYDSTPFNKLNPNIVVLHSTEISTRVKPSIKKSIDILIYNINTREEKKVAKSHAWNWQQGSRIHWLNEETIMYNDYRNEVLHAVSLNILTNVERKYSISINAVYRNLYALTLDYVDLTMYSEYGYGEINENNKIDGIKILDLKDNTTKHLLSKTDVIKLLKTEFDSILSKEHINHISISPDGSRFVFIYRGYDKDKRIDYLLLFDLKEKELSLILGNITISHYAWMDNVNVIFWGKIKGVGGYYKININSRATELLLESRDGHPTMLSNGNMITDTYSDKYANQELYIYNFKIKKKYPLLHIFHPILYKAFNRCDLHPSISLDGKMFQIDTRYKGNRSVLIGKIPEYLLSKSL